MPTSPIKIIILVHGGLVQSIHTDGPERVEVKVYDLDAASFETNAENADREARETEYERAAEGMTEVY